MKGDWLREEYVCLRCDSIARWRALFVVLEQEVWDWRVKDIFESSPAGAAADRMRRECSGYVASHYHPDLEPGSQFAGFRVESLESLTFSDESFDLVITQDVFEHIPRPDRAFSEISRVLRKDGVHIFTVPYFRGQPSRKRAEPTVDGGTRLIEPAEYHGNPVDPAGSLVITDWGDDIVDFIASHGGMATSVLRPLDPGRGIEGACDVLVSRKVG